MPRPARARIAAAVNDPEVPVLTIEDLGVLRDVRADGDRVTVTITPTYSGCPAMDVIRDDLVLALTAAGFERRRGAADALARLDDGLDDGCRQAKLTEYGIAPPTGRAAVGPDQALARREVPALRFARHPGGLALRLDLVQGALRVPRVPRAVRPLQGALMVLQAAGDPVERQGRGSGASTTRPRSPTRSSRAPSADRPGPASARASTRCASPRCDRSPTRRPR